MTSQEFMTKALAGTTRATKCSSVFVDNDNTVYSYGYHYPLVKIINGKAYINDRGYSVSTAKHIGWAFSAAANIVGWDNCFQAPLVRGGSLTPDDILLGVNTEIDRLQAQMDAKKRKDTKTYAWLLVQQERMRATAKAIKESI